MTRLALAFWVMVAVISSAGAGQKIRYWTTLPAVEFDKPYTGELMIMRFASEQDLRAVCRGVEFKHHAVACAGTPKDRPPDQPAPWCRIYIGTDQLLRAAGFSLALTLRHELGHCNGWRHGNGKLDNGRRVYADTQVTMPTLPPSTKELPAYPPLVCVTSDWKAEPCAERKPDPPVRTWAEIYRYLYRTTWLRSAVYKRPAIDESVWELEVAKTMTGKNFMQRTEGNL
jgi:hypothetical protein